MCAKLSQAQGSIYGLKLRVKVVFWWSKIVFLRLSRRPHIRKWPNLVGVLVKAFLDLLWISAEVAAVHAKLAFSGDPGGFLREGGIFCR